MINVAVKAARAAGAIINRAALDVESVRVSQKQVNDFVTEVDQAAEVAIIETLLAAYPGHGIWAEESGRTHCAQDSNYVWIIDPLDGTTNFIHGLPTYAVSIALAHRGQVQQAVVYDPARNVWIKLPPMPVPVHGVTGCSFINGLIHLTGGGMMEGGASGGLLHQVFRPAAAYR